MADQTAGLEKRQDRTKIRRGSVCSLYQGTTHCQEIPGRRTQVQEYIEPRHGIRGFGPLQNQNWICIGRCIFQSDVNKFHGIGLYLFFNIPVHFDYFLPGDAMHKRGLWCRPVSVRPSVRHVGVLYPDGWRYRQTYFSAL